MGKFEVKGNDTSVEQLMNYLVEKIKKVKVNLSLTKLLKRPIIKNTFLKGLEEHVGKEILIIGRRNPRSKKMKLYLLLKHVWQYIKASQKFCHSC